MFAFALSGIIETAKNRAGVLKTISRKGAYNPVAMLELSFLVQFHDPDKRCSRSESDP